MSEEIVLEENTAESDEPTELIKMDNLAAAKYKQHKYSEAVDLLQHAYDLRCKSLGLENLETISTLNNLASALGKINKLHESETYLRRVLSLREKLLGESHHDTLISVSHLGVVLKQQYHLSESELFLMRAYQGFVHSGLDPLFTAEAAYNLAVLYVQKGNRFLAHEYFRIAHKGLGETLGQSHQHTLDALHWEIKCNLSSRRSACHGGHSIINSYDTEHNYHEVNVESYISQYDWISYPTCFICAAEYTFLKREHHCRICSRSVCSDCWSGKAMVLEYSSTQPVRICTICVKQGF